MLIIRNGQEIQTGVYRKSTYTGMYIHWKSYAPSSWKCSTLNTLIMKTYTISPNDSYLRLKLKYFQKVLNEQNKYPHWFLTKVMNEDNRLNIPREHFQAVN